MQNLKNCPICNQNLFTLHKKVIDHAVSQEIFLIQKCVNCDFLFTNPRPTNENLGTYYKSKTYISHHSKKKSFINIVYKRARAFMVNYKINKLNKYFKEGPILDYGAGNGFFLQSLINQKFDAIGYEPSIDAIANAEKQIQSKIYSEISCINNDFQAITLWHVLEHIPNLQETVKHLYQLIKPNGMIIIAVPNCLSEDQKYYDTKWAAFDVPRHLSHFTQSTMNKLLTINGFKHIETFPLILDAYFVSLLSEKYCGNKFPWFKAFLNGFKSNTKAKKTTEYSSLVYVYQK